MSVSDISSALASQSVPPAQKAEQPEAKGPGGRDLHNDRDNDDRAAVENAGPSINLSGNTVGVVISKKA